MLFSGGRIITRDAVVDEDGGGGGGGRDEVMDERAARRPASTRAHADFSASRELHRHMPIL